MFSEGAESGGMREGSGRVLGESNREVMSREEKQSDVKKLKDKEGKEREVKS